eukprot:gene40636-29446_t
MPVPRAVPLGRGFAAPPQQGYKDAGCRAELALNVRARARICGKSGSTRTELEMQHTARIAVPRASDSPWQPTAVEGRAAGVAGCVDMARRIVQTGGQPCLLTRVSVEGFGASCIALRGNVASVDSSIVTLIIACAGGDGPPVAARVSSVFDAEGRGPLRQGDAVLFAWPSAAKGGELRTHAVWRTAAGAEETVELTRLGGAGEGGKSAEEAPAAATRAAEPATMPAPEQGGAEPATEPGEPADLEVGDRCEYRTKDGTWKAAVITGQHVGNGTYAVRDTDGGGELADLDEDDVRHPQRPPAAKPPPAADSPGNAASAG